MHEFLKLPPFDLFELHLIHLVAELGSFTKAGSTAGLSQSAITRQIQGVENRLSLQLFDRTTRKVVLTPAGEFFLRSTNHISGDVSATVRALREEFGNMPRVIRVGISRTVSLAYLPGFFVANRRSNPQQEIVVVGETGRNILGKVASDELDVGIVCLPENPPQGIRFSHRFSDGFVLIAPDSANPPSTHEKQKWIPWMSAQNWLMISKSSQTGLKLSKWLDDQGWKIRAGMELDSFDSIIHLVAMGMGVAFVPHRALAIYGHKKGFRRHTTPRRFSRELAVVTRECTNEPKHVENFVKNVLF